MSYPVFDRSQLNLLPVAERVNDMTMDDVMQLDADLLKWDGEELLILAERIQKARKAKKPIILMMGAHVIKRGMSRFVIEMMRRGWITHICMNGACAIHDSEMAMFGATTESVARYITEGQFGLWHETGFINESAVYAQQHQIGFGEAIGLRLVEKKVPNLEVSIIAKAYQLGVPVTLHVGIGSDIVHEHPNMDGAATGWASYRDFLIFTYAMQNLQDGVVMNIGTAVMGPEVYLKALSMVRNVAQQRGEKINHFTSAVFDLISIENPHMVAPKTESIYYYRPYKTILVRTIQDGGESFYIQGDHRATISTLYHYLLKQADKE
ncbi:MAG: hypothetical protein K8R40_02555 [Anaerolineaceae bacterium]|nr:hypothetical protein [Anaerolineaceae bacterium]